MTMPVEAAAIETTADAIDASKEAFQAVIDKAQSKSQTLIDQRDAAEVIRRAKTLEINDLNKQIAALEGPDAKEARLRLESLSRPIRGPGLR